MKIYLSIYLFFFVYCVRHSSCNVLELNEGEPCMDGFNNGTCTVQANCKTPTAGRRDYAVCSVQFRRRIICCPHESIRSPITSSDESVIDPRTKRILVKTGQKAWDKCLDYLRDVNYPCKEKIRMNSVSTALKNSLADTPKKGQKTISPSKIVERAHFPHMALLGYDNKITESISWMCGGSVISDRFILTAGHCTSHRDHGSVKHIGLGMLRRNDPPSMWQRHRVQRIIAHPDYHAPTVYNDIALLQTRRRISFSKQVAPACLPILKPSQSSVSFMPESVTATGWGYQGSNTVASDYLQMVDLQKYSDVECATIYTSSREMLQGYNSTTQICYGDRTKANDTCQGDSGGALQRRGQASSCQHSIYAVASIGGACLTTSGLYTRVLPYVPWIESVVWP